MRDVGQPDRIKDAIQAEDQMYDSKINSGEVAPNEHKRSAKDDEEELANEAS